MSKFRVGKKKTQSSFSCGKQREWASQSCKSSGKAANDFAHTSMRSRLLLSVTHLPTISETGETLPGGGLHAQAEETLDGLDEYVRSISQLAQPSLLSRGLPGPCQSSHKPPRPQRTRGKAARRGVVSCSSEMVQANAASLQDITTQFNGQHGPQGFPGSADPLDWLFGLSGPREQSMGLRRWASLAPCSSQMADAEGSAALLKTGGGNGSASSDPSNTAQKLSGLAPPLERRGRWQRLCRRTAVPSSAARVRPGRAQSTHLPVIYEL